VVVVVIEQSDHDNDNDNDNDQDSVPGISVTTSVLIAPDPGIPEVWGHIGPVPTRRRDIRCTARYHCTFAPAPQGRRGHPRARINV
ncbi:hypothetical protein, partial [uncultured Thiodictyon sp.]|uniref:hypothetical protein n=1 Tax=uncultured Thiodictyon sp. TaxID=1846217 RepID=UPI0025DDAF68